MKFSLLLTFLFLTVPATVMGCEGECIVGVTNAVVGNYSTPVQHVMDRIAEDIASLASDYSSRHPASRFIRPVMAAYDRSAYSGMETAIFPSFFHGKCLIDGVEPDGCPNPDCPVVCGTPGSIVHFFPKFRYIGFNQTRNLLKTLTTPGSPTYNDVERMLLDAAAQDAPPSRRTLRVHSRSSALGSTGFSATKRDDENLKAGLRNIMAQVEPLLSDQCGGTPYGATNGLPECSWEREMKEYILTFP
ncbi:hypothetical protein K474DRAFT_1666197 [Panus rudis PR-1116 ss-1]|nr:hypothetical protein K474DRAFT_1666197 [Panus rudis PR-1116 ss-1]